MVLIGMPGLEKRLARYPQLYSRVGFVHEFKPLSQADVRQLLRERWCPSGVSLPNEGSIDEEAIGTLTRIVEGKFRLLRRLLTQIGRVMEINRLDKVTREVVEAARESLVIGTV
jgi:DNA transposition AAA+ family ATPase